MTKKEALEFALDGIEFYLEHGFFLDEEEENKVDDARSIINAMVDEMNYFEQRRKANES